MRLWSIDPALLDCVGLVALWREALLAQAVLLGKTRGYRNHPQLERFKKSKRPVEAIAAYLWAVKAEAAQRGYAFDEKKIAAKRRRISIAVTRGQLEYEVEHLRKKLRVRDHVKLAEIAKMKRIKHHPIFQPIPGGIAAWEKI